MCCDCCSYFLEHILPVRLPRLCGQLWRCSVRGGCVICGQFLARKDKSWRRVRTVSTHFLRLVWRGCLVADHSYLHTLQPEKLRSCYLWYLLEKMSFAVDSLVCACKSVSRSLNVRRPDKLFLLRSESVGSTVFLKPRRDYVPVSQMSSMAKNIYIRNIRPHSLSLLNRTSECSLNGVHMQAWSRQKRYCVQNMFSFFFLLCCILAHYKNTQLVTASFPRNS